MSTKLSMMPEIILIEPVSGEVVRESGIVIAETNQSVTNYATITDIHSDAEQMLGFGVGTRVMYNPWAAREVNIDGTTKRLALRVGDILARVEGE